MTHEPLPYLLAALRHTAVLLTMRVLPVATYVVLAKGSGIYRRFVWGVGYLGFPILAYCLGAGRSIGWQALGLGYYLLVGLGTNRLRRWLADGHLTRGGALMTISFAYLVLPGVLLPGVSLSTFLVVGCELALSSYSYCVETCRRGAATPPLAGCLFFLFVNPTVVYTVRGAPIPGPYGVAGWWRAAAGIAIMFVNVALLRPIAHELRTGGALGVALGGPAPVRLLVYGVVTFLTIYAAHSGLASIQIGLMRQVGWSVPERYRYPLRSTSPVDFWRRWNTYVRMWLEAYVFLPIARQVSRQTKRSSGQVAAAAVTLVASGALHGAVTFSGRQNLADLKGESEFFLAAGALLIVWRATSAACKAIRARLQPMQARRFDAIAQVSARLSVASALVAATIAWA